MNGKVFDLSQKVSRHDLDISEIEERLARIQVDTGTLIGDVEKIKSDVAFIKQEHGEKLDYIVSVLSKFKIGSKSVEVKQRIQIAYWRVALVAAGIGAVVSALI